MPHLPHFGHGKNFSQKVASFTCMHLLNPNFMQKNPQKGNELYLRKLANERTDKAETARPSDRGTRKQSNDTCVFCHCLVKYKIFAC